MDGKGLAGKIKEEIIEKCRRNHIKPCLAVVVIGEDPSNLSYLKGKRKDIQDCGFESKEYILPLDISGTELIERIRELSLDKSIDGILLQLPLPKHLQWYEDDIINEINPDKDVDCLHYYNLGLLYTVGTLVQPCTPSAVIRLLKEYKIDLEGKHCVILGRSNIVGKPMAMLCLQENATVTICHSKTKNLSDITKQADIVISAIGKPNYITADMIKDGAVVIDVGINYNSDGKLCGDVAFDEVSKKTSYITPVPGGVGPVTRAMLMLNTLNLAEMRRNINEEFSKMIIDM